LRTTHHPVAPGNTRAAAFAVPLPNASTVTVLTIVVQLEPSAIPLLSTWMSRMLKVAPRAAPLIVSPADRFAAPPLPGALLWFMVAEPNTPVGGMVTLSVQLR